MAKLEGKNVIVIGSGFGGLGAACLLGKAGAKVQMFEKNEAPGGRASVFEAEGFRFDMGPSWYLMPDIFEQFFRLMGERVEDHLQLHRLEPSYKIFFKDTGKEVEIFSDMSRDAATLEKLEPGSADRMRDYLARAEKQYAIATQRFMYKNYRNIFDFLTWEVMTQGPKLSVFSSMQRYVSKFFSTDEVQKIVQYPLVFLGSSPYNTPALYNIMSHIDFNMGVYYPMGGIYTIIEALVKIAQKHGVQIRTSAAVETILVKDGRAVGVRLENGEEHFADEVVSNADIHFTETKLLDASHRSFTDAYWEKRVLSPSAFILYLGVEGKIPEVVHHNLVFSKDWKKNFGQIFDQPTWPDDPSYYVCAPSVTDDSVAPAGKENLFVLVPIAPGMEEDDALLEAYAEKVLEGMERDMGIANLRERICYKRIFSGRDFEERYNSFKGTALGLAHTFFQTAIFRPDTVSKKIPNLYYVGASTNPGIGMPTCLISAELVYKRMVGDGTAGPLNEV